MKDGTIFKDKITGSIGVITDKGSSADIWLKTYGEIAKRLSDKNLIRIKKFCDGIVVQGSYEHCEYNRIVDDSENVNPKDYPYDQYKNDDRIFIFDLPRYAHWHESDVDIIGNIFDLDNIKKIVKEN